jgi:2-polyprenyl-3-methyl-5-hydroxy-6-metoxy-1,4-benzoquinol methylase
MTTAFGFTPDHNEAARQAFVGSFKRFVNFDVEGALAPVLEAESANSKAPPTDRAGAACLLEPHPLYQLWASLTYHSQNMMWDAVQDTTDRIVDAQVNAFTTLAGAATRKGSIALSDKLVVKAPIATTEIHRQPGGYWRERRRNDVEAALNYAGTVDLYRRAKGMSTAGPPSTDAMGRFVAGVAQRYAPDLQPRAILDMGCGTGEETLAYKRTWPDAQVCGIDCARPFIRFAHAHAEANGVAVDFAEMDAGATRFADASFDLIVSIIMFHETTRAQVHDILRENWRLLRPGGLVLHLDVPYQPHRMPLVKQVTNHWQVRHNGEPFWTGFAELDMSEELLRAGFDAEHSFARYEQSGPATYFFFGGRKPQ